MDLSDFEQRVLDALVKSDPERETLQAQLAEATVLNRDYSGVGLFTKLAVPESAPRLQDPGRYIEKIPKLHLEHPDLTAGAGAMLWLTNGRADTLECYTYDGDWPSEEGLFEIAE